MKREGGTAHAEALGPPRRFAVQVARLRHKSYRNTATPGRRKPRAPGRGRSNRHATQPADNGKDTPEQTEPTGGNALRRDPPTARDRTPSDGKRTAEATRQKTQTQSTNEPPKPRAKRTDARQDTHHTPPLGGTRHDKTKGRDARRTGHETPKARKRQKQSSKTQRHTPQRNRRTRTTNGREPRRAGATNRGDKRHKPHRATRSTKNADTAKNRKTRAKKMVVGGKLLRGGKLQAQKRPF